MKKEINGRRTRDQASVRTDSRTSAPFAAVETDKTQYLGDINKEEQAPRRIVIAADEFTGRKAAAKSQEQRIGTRLSWRQQSKCKRSALGSLRTGALGGSLVDARIRAQRSQKRKELYLEQGTVLSHFSLSL